MLATQTWLKVKYYFKTHLMATLHNKAGVPVMLVICLKNNSRTSNNKTNNAQSLYGTMSNKLSIII